MRADRRRLRFGLAVVGSAAFFLAGWAFWIEPDGLLVRRVDLRLSSWPYARPLTVAAIGDLHAGAPHVDAAKVDEVVARINEARPDLVVLLGDYVIHGVVGGDFQPPEAFAPALGRLRAPAGVVSVLGNHDWWYDGTRVRRALEAQGIRVLEDETIRVETASGPVWLAGLADLWTRPVDVEGTLRRVPEDGAPVLVLTHSPDVFPRVSARAALTLAAHTHGGQVRLPLVGAPVVPSAYGQRYAAGHVVEGGRHLFVTTGVGTSIVPVRFRVPPEIALVVVSRGK